MCPIALRSLIFPDFYAGTTFVTFVHNALLVVSWWVLNFRCEVKLFFSGLQNTLMASVSKFCGRVSLYEHSQHFDWKDDQTIIAGYFNFGHEVLGIEQAHSDAFQHRAEMSNARIPILPRPSVETNLFKFKLNIISCCFRHKKWSS